MAKETEIFGGHYADDGCPVKDYRPLPIRVKRFLEGIPVIGGIIKHPLPPSSEAIHAALQLKDFLEKGGFDAKNGEKYLPGDPPFDPNKVPADTIISITEEIYQANRDPRRVRVKATGEIATIFFATLDKRDTARYGVVCALVSGKGNVTVERIEGDNSDEYITRKEPIQVGQWQHRAEVYPSSCPNSQDPLKVDYFQRITRIDVLAYGESVPEKGKLRFVPHPIRL